LAGAESRVPVVLTAACTAFGSLFQLRELFEMLAQINENQLMDVYAAIPDGAPDRQRQIVQQLQAFFVQLNASNLRRITDRLSGVDPSRFVETLVRRRMGDLL
jgi:hypothetical protein